MSELQNRLSRCVALLGCSLAPAGGLLLGQGTPANPPRVAINDNRTAAGTFRNGVLTLRLEISEGTWHPDGDADPGMVMRAFAESGQAPAIPGPLLRVTEGTEIRARVTNRLPVTQYVHGLSTRGLGDSLPVLRLEPGESREVRFRAGNEGTWFYWASSKPGALTERPPEDAELSAAFVIDPAGTRGTPPDRVMVLTEWNRDARPGGIVLINDLLRFTINGKAWPHTEQLAYDVGDTIRFRIVNASEAPHPMHLHGFYFGVETRADERQETRFKGEAVPQVVTERLAPGRTFSLLWVPERAGNWLFHCHNNFHIMRGYPLDGSRPAPEPQHVENHALEMMGGLVMGIAIRQPGPDRVADVTPRRKLRLFAEVDSGATAAEPFYRYRLEEGNTSTGSGLPGPTILLRKGEPVSITVVNRLPEPTAVHWHGIELDSYMDGVAGFSGHPGRIAPVIAPNDSFQARFTPPRSGTFIYHPHADEVRQQQAGLSGALLVVDDPAKHDPTRDMVVLISTPRREADGSQVLLNGSLAPSVLELRQGERYRFRIINIHIYRPSIIMRLLRDSVPETWRAVAKDGMDLPAGRAVSGPAVQQFGNGEAYDFEFIPGRTGTLRLTASSGVGVLLATIPIRVSR